MLTIALVGGADQLAEALTSDAVGWSPVACFRSRAEAVEQRREHAASLGVVDLSIDRVWWWDPIAFAEWRLTATQDAPLLVADDLLVEPSDRTITVAGASLATLAGDRIAQLHSYYDDAAVIEQALASARAMGGGALDPRRAQGPARQEHPGG